VIENIAHYEPSLGPFLTPLSQFQAHLLSAMHSDIHNTSLLHRTAAQLGKHPNAKILIQNNYETDITSVTKTHGDLNPPPMVTVMPVKLSSTTTTSLCTFNCVLHKGQVHTIRPGGCCLLALVQGSKQRYKLKDDLKHSDAY